MTTNNSHYCASSCSGDPEICPWSNQRNVEQPGILEQHHLFLGQRGSGWHRRFAGIGSDHKWSARFHPHRDQFNVAVLPRRDTINLFQRDELRDCHPRGYRFIAMRVRGPAPGPAVVHAYDATKLRTRSVARAGYKILHRG